MELGWGNYHKSNIVKLLVDAELWFILIHPCAFEYVRLKCQLQSGGELVEIDSPQEIIFHLPPAVTIQSHNLQWMLECLVFDH